MTRNSDILLITEYIKNVLYFAVVRVGKTLNSTSEVHYFSIDNDLVYENYYSDFGPLNLGCVYKYCKILKEKLQTYLNKQTIVHYTSADPKKKANAAFLLGCYGVLYLSLTPRDALKPLQGHGQTYRPFQDATQGESAYTLSLIDCLRAIKRARELGFFNFQDFNYEEYERLDTIQGGDLNWIVPGKFLAFIGPVDYSVSLFHPPEMYIDYFKDNNVKIVIRLNKRMYDGDVFNNAGIFHYDLFFPDGSCPPRHILMKFLQIAEDAHGIAIAVHCKAGLGRTGSLIGCYLMKHYRMTAHEAIGWMRICRPGSVIGHQQGWLEHLEPWLIKQGNLYRKRMYQDVDKLPTHEFGVYSITEKALQRRPSVLNKPPSSPPLPPINRVIRSDMSPPRPQASKVREAPSKAAEAAIHDWRLKVKMSKGCQPNKQPLEQSQRVSSGAGEPRIGSPKAGSRMNTGHMASRPRLNEHPNIRETSSPIPTFRTTQGSILKTLSDAKNFLMKSSLYSQQRDQQSLNSSVIVTPFLSSGYHPTIAPSKPPHASASRTPIAILQQQRRRLPLGRSPSPSPSSSPTRHVEQTRATNTVPSDKFLAKDRTTIREALSNLRLKGPRAGGAGSIGAASVGAASLGACRDAPAGHRAPSVRSDERPIATQGDMLNSIKLQRRFREIDKTMSTHISDKARAPVVGASHLYSSRMNPVVGSSNLYSSRMNPVVGSSHLYSSRTTPPKDRSRPENSSRSPLWGPAATGSSGQRNSPSSSTTRPTRFPPSRFPPAPSRPTSPKGRTRTTSFY